MEGKEEGRQRAGEEREREAGEGHLSEPLRMGSCPFHFYAPSFQCEAWHIVGEVNGCINKEISGGLEGLRSRVFLARWSLKAVASGGLSVAAGLGFDVYCESREAKADGPV